MSIISVIPGAYVFPMRQAICQSSGVRGMFLRHPAQRGTLLMSVPFRYCFLPHGLRTNRQVKRSPRVSAMVDNREQMKLIYRYNRSNALFPEAWVWLHRFSTTAPSDRVSLSFSVSLDREDCVDDDDDLLNNDDGCDNNLSNEENQHNDAHETRSHYNNKQLNKHDVHKPAVLTVNLSPVEAMLTTCIALRFFFTTALSLGKETRERLHLASGPSALADKYVSSLPLARLIQNGVESLYGDCTDFDESHVHMCVEQLAYNIRDTILQHVNMEEYKLIDTHASMFDEIVLAALYTVRARVLYLPLLHSANPCEDVMTSVYAPGLDMCNHSSYPSAVAVLSRSLQRVVVRACCDLRANDEVTLYYHSLNTTPTYRDGNKRCDRTHLTTPAFFCKGNSSNSYELIADDLWQSRYLLNNSLQ